LHRAHVARFSVSCAFPIDLVMLGFPLWRVSIFGGNRSRAMTRCVTKVPVRGEAGTEESRCVKPHRDRRTLHSQWFISAPKTPDRRTYRCGYH